MMNGANWLPPDKRHVENGRIGMDLREFKEASREQGKIVEI